MSNTKTTVAKILLFLHFALFSWWCERSSHQSLRQEMVPTCDYRITSLINWKYTPKWTTSVVIVFMRRRNMPLQYVVLCHITCLWTDRINCSVEVYIVQQQQHPFKGTLRRRLSHGYFSFIAKYTSSWLMSHRSHPQIITFKGAEPNFLAWHGEIWSMLWNLIQLLIATHHFMNYVSSFPLTQVWIYATLSSQICSY